MHRHGLQGLALVAVLAAVGVASAAAATVGVSGGIDVCPAASWQGLLFLSTRTPYAAINATVQNATKDKAVQYIKSHVVPRAGANAFFLVLSMLFCLAFVLWRTTRWCCHVGCCRDRCDARRAQHDPFKLLFSKGMTVLKVFMVLLGLATTGMAAFGMAKVQPNLVNETWKVLGDLTAYATNVTSTIDNLMYSIGNTSTHIDSFQLIVNNTMNVTGLQANLTAAAAFVSVMQDPAVLSAKLSTLSNDTAVLSAALSTMVASLAALSSIQLPAIKANMLVLSGAAAGLGSMSSLLSDLDTAIGNLPAGDPDVTAATFVAFDDAVTAATAGASGDWITSIDSLLTAISTLQGYQGSSNNPFTSLKADVSNTSSAATNVTGTSLSAFRAPLGTFIAQNATGFPPMLGLLMQLQRINVTVLQLDANTTTAFGLIYNTELMLRDLGALSPSPAALHTLLGSANASVAEVASTATLVANLGTAAAALDGLALSTAATNLNNLKSSLGTAFQTAFTTMQSDRDTYKFTQSDWTIMRNSANTLKPSLAPLTSSMDSAASQLTAMALPTATTDINSVSATLLSAQSAYATGAQLALAGLPDLTGTGAFGAALGALGTCYVALGMPPAAVFQVPSVLLSAVSSVAVTTGNSVKLQIDGTVSAISSGTGMLKTGVTGNLQTFKKGYEAPIRLYDSYRYQSSMVLYGLSFLWIMVLCGSYYVNYHFGANAGMLCLATTTMLYFLLAFVITVVLVVLGDACPNVEPLVTSFVPSQQLPIVRYYFYNEGTSIKAVLRSSGLVDVDAVLKEARIGKDTLVTGIGSAFTLRAAPLAVLSRINATYVDAQTNANALLAAMSYAPVNALFTQIKSLLCCTIADALGTMWVGLTYTGVLACCMVFCTFFYIGKLDATPRKDCMGCTCHTLGAYSGPLDSSSAPTPNSEAHSSGFHFPHMHMPKFPRMPQFVHLPHLPHLPPLPVLFAGRKKVKRNEGRLLQQQGGGGGFMPPVAGTYNSYDGFSGSMTEVPPAHVMVRVGGGRRTKDVSKDG